MRLPIRSVRTAGAIALALAAVAGTAGFTGQHQPSWELSPTGTTERLRGLSAVSARTAWVSGSGGVVLRTVDGGRTWLPVGPPDVADLQFRDIEAFDRRRAVALSIGEGDASRIYRTVDGGRTWTETFRNDDPLAFYDCLAFFDDRHGLALSDPVDGRFRILSTADGGRSWRVLPTDGMPAALPGEFAFAASGTCLVTAARGGHGAAWFATGGGATARVFRTGNAGRSWTVTDTPVPSGPTAGIYSLAFLDARHGVAVGGDFAAPTVAPDAAARSRDGGRTWQPAAAAPGEYRSGSAWLASGHGVLAVGPTGSDISRDGGRTWRRFDTGSFDSVDCVPGGCWASGEAGRVARLR
jgi:photosystem II stability/assembly factor-like uncharacterized protein